MLHKPIMGVKDPNLHVEGVMLADAAASAVLAVTCCIRRVLTIDGGRMRID